MAFQIQRNSVFLKELPDRYQKYATVRSLQRVGLQKYFGPKAGTVWVSLPEGPDRPFLRVVVPEWKGGRGKEWELLWQSYEKVLQLAADRHCEAVVIPLLTAENPGFPAYIDFKIAVDTIWCFSESHTMDVYLIALRPTAFQMPELRADVERFLARHTQEETLPWSSRPFETAEERSATLVPPQTAPFSADAFYGAASGLPENAEGEALWDDASMEYDEADFSEDWDEAPKCSRKKAIPARAAFPKRIIMDGAPRRRPNKADLEKLLEKTDAGFSETLLKLIDQTGKKDSDIYNRANVSRQHFSKIRNNPNYKPTKPTAIAFAIALELNLEQTEDLIGRAGYRLTTSSQFDLIIMYFIEQRNYNMFDINETLYEFDQSLLGT